MSVFPIFVKFVVIVSWDQSSSQSGYYLDQAEKMYSSRLVIPISCDRLFRQPSRDVCEAAVRSNADVIGFLLREVDLAAMPRPADERLAEALAPLRTKLDMIIGLLGRLTYRNIELPPIHDIEFEPGRITWLSTGALDPGDWLRISLFFHPIFREPVVVFGKVTSCAENGRSACWRLQADLAEMPNDIRDNIRRLAFLTLRRQWAQRPVHSALTGAA